MAKSVAGIVCSDSRSDVSEQSVDMVAEPSPAGTLTTEALLRREQHANWHTRRHITDLKGTAIGVAEFERPRDLSFRGNCQVSDLLNTSPYYARHASVQEERNTGKWFVLLPEFRPTHLLSGDTIAAPHEYLSELSDPLVLIVSKQD